MDCLAFYARHLGETARLQRGNLHSIHRKLFSLAVGV
jgi:hypothetical protein